jgi:ElaB/YqjD/DUF883 family membrane-anchored ribosome-binding protein
MYLKSLIETVVGWAAGGAAGAITVAQAAGADLLSGRTWAGIGVAAGIGLVKGLASKYGGNPESATITS